MPDDNYSRTSRANFPFNRDSTAPDAESHAAASDPLAELARLIGQNDPLGESPLSRPERDLRDILSGRHVNGDWPAAGAPSEGDDDISLDQDELGHPAAPTPTFDRSFSGHGAAPPVVPQDRDDLAHDADDEYSDEPESGEAAPETAAYEAASDYGQDAPEGPYYGDNGELSEHDPYAHEAYSEEAPPKRRRGGLIAAVAVFGLAVVGTAGAYAYRTVFSAAAPSTPPLIKADATPNKVVPAAQSSEGGKQIYDRLGDRGQGEKVVSREEQPLDIKDRAAGSRAGGSTMGAPASGSMPPSALTANGWPVQPGSAAPQGGATLTAAPAPTASTTSASPGSEPRKVRTVTIRSDQAGADAAKPTAAGRAATADSAAVTASASAPAARAQPPRPSAPLTLTPADGADERPARSAALAPRATASTGGGYVVQVSAQKTQEEASASFRAMQAKYPNVLGGRQMVLRKKEVAGKGTFYGAQVGPFAARDDAVQLCEQLKSAGGTCMVQKN